MHGRSPVAAFTVALACAAALPAAASAQVPMGSLDQAAGFADFPVYAVTRAPGLRVRTFSVAYNTAQGGCDDDAKTVFSDYRRRRAPAQRWIHLIQSTKPCRAGGSHSRKVRQVKVLGRRVTIRRSCADERPDCQHPDGVFTAKFSLRTGGQRTHIEVEAGARVGLRGVVRALRSLRLVDLTRPHVQFEMFRAADGRIFCWIFDTPGNRYTQCDTGVPDTDPNRSVSLNTDGTIGVCDQDPNGCFVQWVSNAPLLAAGQRTRFGRFTCIEQTGTVTCTVARGEHAGQGFRIDLAGITAISP